MLMSIENKRDTDYESFNYINGRKKKSEKKQTYEIIRNPCLSSLHPWGSEMPAGECWYSRRTFW